MCGEKMEVYVPSNLDLGPGLGYKKITVRCGDTSLSGDPHLCPLCTEIHKDRNWRQEAEDMGETWEEEEEIV